MIVMLTNPLPSLGTGLVAWCIMQTYASGNFAFGRLICTLTLTLALSHAAEKPVVCPRLLEVSRRYTESLPVMCD